MDIYFEILKTIHYTTLIGNIWSSFCPIHGIKSKIEFKGQMWINMVRGLGIKTVHTNANTRPWSQWEASMKKKLKHTLEIPMDNKK